MRKNISIIIAAFVLFAAAAPALAITVDKIVRNVDNRYKSLNAFSASMWLIASSAYLGEETYKGKIYARHPNNFRLEYTEPMKQTLVFDGSTFWIFTPTTKQVIVYDVSGISGDESVWDMYQMGKEDYTFKLLGKKTLKGDIETYKLKLTAKSSAQTFQTVYIWVDSEEWVSRRVDMIDGEGNSNSYRLFNFDFNPSISASKFTFKTPEGVTEIKAEDIGM
ncbi:MAG: outer membrane lipoprotein chaperone LolA [bacterium]|nr:outer membrane lipoprotein chaperone LolA [bacterium]